jgi:hypothetical protein
MDGSATQVEEFLISMCEALSSNPAPPKTKQKKHNKTEDSSGFIFTMW